MYFKKLNYLLFSVIFSFSVTGTLLFAQDSGLETTQESPSVEKSSSVAESLTTGEEVSSRIVLMGVISEEGEIENHEDDTGNFGGVAKDSKATKKNDGASSTGYRIAYIFKNGLGIGQSSVITKDTWKLVKSGSGKNIDVLDGEDIVKLDLSYQATFIDLSYTLSFKGSFFTLGYGFLSGGTGKADYTWANFKDQKFSFETTEVSGASIFLDYGFKISPEMNLLIGYRSNSLKYKFDETKSFLSTQNGDTKKATQIVKTTGTAKTNQIMIGVSFNLN